MVSSDIELICLYGIIYLYIVRPIILFDDDQGLQRRILLHLIYINILTASFHPRDMEHDGDIACKNSYLYRLLSSVWIENTYIRFTHFYPPVNNCGCIQLTSGHRPPKGDFINMLTGDCHINLIPFLSSNIFNNLTIFLYYIQLNPFMKSPMVCRI
jgi:hypothetical protein